MNWRSLLTRKNSLLAVVGLLLIGIGWLAMSFLINYFSLRAVTITLDDKTTSITISNKTELVGCAKSCPGLTEITLSKSSQVRLADGRYLITPSGDNIRSVGRYIDVSQETTSFTVSPGYSEEYLRKLLGEEKTAINYSTHQAYQNIPDQYAITDEGLYRYGDWYVGLLSLSDGGNSDVYSIILHKGSGKWEVAAPPSIYHQYSLYPSVPKDIIYLANTGALKSSW